MRKEIEKPKDVELWVTSETHGKYKARTLSGVYQSDVNKAVSCLEKFLDTRWPEERRIMVVEVKNEK